MIASQIPTASGWSSTIRLKELGIVIRVLVVDDQRLVREEQQLLLRRANDIEVVGEARDGQEAVLLAAQLSPDVITMDIKMPRLDGLQATREIVKQGPLPILIVAGSWSRELLNTALQYGSKGYVAKPDAWSELVPGVRALHTGGMYFSQTILALRGNSSAN